MLQLGRIVRHLVFGLVGVLAFAGPAAVAAVPSQVQSSREKVACPFDTGKALLAVECGRLKVPENYEDAKRTIELGFMIVRPARNRDPGNPVLYLSGGPGAPSLVFAELLLATPQVRDIVVDRDWVFFDQRGAGRSAPALSCPREPDYLKRLQNCRDLLIKEGVDLSQYNSARSAQDIEELRKALGVKQWNLWGTSYGSRLAFAVARDFPASVRAILHDGPSDPEGPEVLNDFRGTEAAVHRLLSKCAADPACASKHPDLRSRFLAALPRLRQQPLSVGDERIDDSAVVQVIRDNLFAHSPQVLEGRVQRLIAYMDAAARGDGPSMQQIARDMPKERENEPPVPEEGRYALGQNLSIECSEERAFESVDQYRQAAASSDIVRALVGGDPGSEFRACALWPSGRADPVRKSRVYYDGPQLAFSGELDPSLSGLSGYRIEMLYPQATNVVFRNATHAQVDLADFPPASIDPYRACALRLARQFFADPQARLDGRCAEDRRLRLAP